VPAKIRLLAATVGIMILAGACAKKPPAPPTPQPPPAAQNVVVLLPEPEGTSSGLFVKNQAGSQDLTQPYQAVRVPRADVAPGAPFTMDQAEVRRVFGAALDVLPKPEVVFVLHFDEGSDALNAASQAQMPDILNAIRDRQSTAITVTGHTDTTADPQFNYQLGLRRAQRVTGILQSQGVNASDLFVSSHGDADLLVQTPRGVAEARNRRVEVIVR
jgi:outer membrane protein OmpA-like peptidoglycan-associated protein